MPVYRHGNCIVRIPEGGSYSFIATPDGAEWYIVPIECNVSLTRGGRYTLKCQDGNLILWKNDNPQEA